MRHFWLLVHRYAGLFMAFFLIVISLTGSIIVFNPELYRWFDPPPVVVQQNKPMLDAYTLRKRAEALVPHSMVNSLTFHIKPGEPYIASIEPRINPANGKPYDLDCDQLMLDPYTGAELRREKYAPNYEHVWPITNKNIMTLINRLHYQLAIPGTFGSYLFGIVALLWTIDCFVSVYLTFPLTLRKKTSPRPSPANRRGNKSWWARWKPAWLVKWHASAYRINFDLHRAGGLWVWLMLLVLAWSSVGFNLYDQVYLPVMKTAFNMPDPYENLPLLPKPQAQVPMNWKQAHTVAKQLMAEQAEQYGFEVEYEDSLQYTADRGVYFYAVRSTHDLMDEGAGTYLFFDGKSGKFAGINLPTGQNTGSTLHSWIFALHMAMIWGWPFRIFVCAMGLVITMLSVTGVYIWWKKYYARQHKALKKC